MTTISIDQWQRDPLWCVARVAAGEPLLLVRDGIAVAELRPVVQPSTEPRPFGLARGEFVVPADFDAPLPEEIVQEFEG